MELLFLMLCIKNNLDLTQPIHPDYPSCIITLPPLEVIVMFLLIVVFKVGIVPATSTSNPPAVPLT